MIGNAAGVAEERAGVRADAGAGRHVQRAGRARSHRWHGWLRSACGPCGPMAPATATRQGVKTPQRRWCSQTCRSCEGVSQNQRAPRAHGAAAHPPKTTPIMGGVCAPQLSARTIPGAGSGRAWALRALALRVPSRLCLAGGVAGQLGLGGLQRRHLGLAFVRSRGWPRIRFQRASRRPRSAPAYPPGRTR